MLRRDSIGDPNTYLKANRGRVVLLVLVLLIRQATTDNNLVTDCSPSLITNRTIYITGFEPAADKKTAHHMLIVGCKTPGKYEPIYNCGAMAAKQKGLSSAINPCGGLGQSIIFAWAQNAPIFNLPKDVAFQAGGKSEIDYLVLQVKYYFLGYNNNSLYVILCAIVRSVPQHLCCN